MAQTADAKSDQYVYFVNLEDGDIVNSPLKIEMGVEGMTIEPAGPINENKGHHHLLVDTTYFEAGTIIPATEKTIHFGKGQTETEIQLSPGKHKLTLQFADGVHRSYGKKMSKTIEITVE
ncbi:MAG: DUF4399 domain-containing protein [Calditrichaeota bacterium]|nr:DUF4399 domain-containing protein [Calditrichota bacterium]